MTVAKLKPEKKHVPHATCDDGHHTYIVTAWTIGGGKQKACQMRCQNCLMPRDLQEIESSEWSGNPVKPK